MKRGFKKILVFSPHPDDDVIGCGGSIALHAQRGREVEVVYVTSGDAGSLKHGPKELSRIREKEARQAAAVLGVKRVDFLRMQDGYVEANAASIRTVVRLIRERQPDAVYIPHERDGHRDHRRTHEFVKEAVFRAFGPWFRDCGKTPWAVRAVLCYEVWTPLEEFSYVEDITGVMKAKMEALGRHASQIGPVSYADGVEGLNRFRGVMTGKGQYCECFKVLHTEGVIE